MCGGDRLLLPVSWAASSVSSPRLVKFPWDDPAWSASFFARMTSSKEDVVWKASFAYLQQVDELPDYHTFGPRYASMPDDVHALLCGP